MAPFVGDVQQVGVHRVRTAACLVLHLHRDAVGLGVGEQLLAREQVPFAPGRDHLDVGLQCVGTEFEAHLIVALAGGAVADGVGAGFVDDVDQALGDQRPRDRGAEQVFALVHGVGAEHRENEVAHEFLAQVVDVDLLRLDAELQRLGACRLQFLALPEVGGKGDHLALVGVLQPFQDDRSVEAAGIGEYNFFDVAHGVWIQ